MHWKIAQAAVCLLGFIVSINAPALAQATDADLSGTYTLVYGSVDSFAIQINTFNGQQVGFCPGSVTPRQIPYGYTCPSVASQDVTTGTVIADGKGNIVAGSTFVLTLDPNESNCSPQYKPERDCPYKVPSGVAWNNTTTYLVGDEVDFTVNGKVLTFQAVAKNTNVPPGTSTCSGGVQPPNCNWVQLIVSAASGRVNFSGTMTGTYTVQANGAGVMQLILVSGAITKKVSLAFVVPTAPLAIGQEIPVVGIPVLGNGTHGNGVAVRVK